MLLSSLAAQIKADNTALFDAALQHPFVQGIGNGSLPKAYFARWIVQDWLYLQAYLHTLQQACHLAPDPSARRFWQDLVRLTQEEELDLHRGLAAKFGLSQTDLDNAMPYSATTEYVNTLQSANGNYAGIVATLTPCAVGYADIAQHLQAQDTCTDPDYRAWIDTYTDAAFKNAVAQFEAEIDYCGQNEQDRAVIQHAYTTAAQCEVNFWQSLWLGQ
ncbi:MAG: hypothetical protein KGY57_04115 [Gammaproteobacteria bacterium]|nr:hypothetical protein [Gammaproteobacteria bacterium]